MKRYGAALSVVLTLGLSTTAAQEPPPIKLTLTPAKPPTPALRYQLLPDARLALSGDAAPLYRKAIQIFGTKPFDTQSDRFDSWRTLPLNEMPKEEVRKALADYDEVYQLLDQAARCDHCNWGILERLRAKGAAGLEQASSLRPCARLLHLRARLAVAEDKLDQALVSLRTGFALTRHIGEADSAVGFLIGVSLAGILQGQLDELVAQPSMPNLYYELTDLPTPLLNLRKPLQGERIFVYASFPGL